MRLYLINYIFISKNSFCYSDKTLKKMLVNLINYCKCLIFIIIDNIHLINKRQNNLGCISVSQKDQRC